MIYIQTRAYNAKETLCGTIESILNQTHREFIYYLCDNGSTDNGATREIVAEYAKRDARIVPFYNEKNHVWEGNEKFRYFHQYIGEDDYYCTLDADDEYNPEFLEKMMALIRGHNLDIAACGYDFVDAQTGGKCGMRALKQNLILQDSKSFSDHFLEYYQFMRTRWCKVYSGRVLQKGDFDKCYTISYGADTVFTIEAFRNAERVGILAESLHNYYVSAESVSYRFDSKRIASDRILFDAAHGFLMAKCGMISPQNLEFLFGVYMNALIDTSYVLLRAKIDMGQKLGHLQDMMDCAYTKQLAALENFGDQIDLGPELRGRRKAHFRAVADWLLSLQEVPDEQFEGFCDMGEFSCAAADFGDGWVQFNKLRVLFLLHQDRKQEAKTRLEELLIMMPNDPDLLSFRGQL